MSDGPDPERLKRLEDRIRAAKGADRSGPRGDGHITQAQTGWRMVTELLAGIGIGFGIGWGLDSLFGTIPLFLVLMTVYVFRPSARAQYRAAKHVIFADERAVHTRQNRLH